MGPIKAPNAKVEVHNPDTSPYVSIVSGKPLAMADLCASANPATTSAPRPRPEEERMNEFQLVTSILDEWMITVKYETNNDDGNSFLQMEEW